VFENNALATGSCTFWNIQIIFFVFSFANATCHGNELRMSQAPSEVKRTTEPKKRKRMKETTLATVGYTIGGAALGYGIARAFQFPSRATLECTAVLAAGGLSRGLVAQFRRKAEIKKRTDCKGNETQTIAGKEVTNSANANGASEYAGALKTLGGIFLVSKVIVPVTVIAGGLVAIGLMSK
jgi:hypothetical protein